MPSIVIIDDQITSITLLKQLIHSIEIEGQSYEINSFFNAQDALWSLQHTTPDLILVDYRLPNMSGIEFIKKARLLPNCSLIPIVMITAYDDQKLRYEALDAGATDFLSKPIDHYECRARCKNLLTLRNYQLRLEHDNVALQDKIVDSMEAVNAREKETLLRLARAGEYRDEVTGNHLLRIAKYSRLIAEALGLPDNDIDIIEYSAPMHDVGKIGIPDEILLKPGKLSENEFEIMKQHALIGYQILKDSPSKYLQAGAEIALGHHENFDGSGYPYGKRANEIPLAARIVAIADVFDALTTTRPYKQDWSPTKALAYISHQAGHRFDPECTKAFISHWADALQIYQDFKDIFPVNKDSDSLSNSGSSP